MQNNFIHTAVPLRLMMSPCHPRRAVSVCFTQPSVSSVGERIIIIFLSVTIKTCCETLWLCRWTGSYFQLQHEQKYNLCSFESCGSVGSSMTSHRLPSAEPCHIMKPWLAGWSVHKETLCLYSQQRVFLHNTIRQRNVGMRNQPGCNQTVREESWQQISAF